MAKAIDNRVSKFIQSLIHTNQTGFMAKRFIGSNLRNISDIITYLQNSEEGGYVISLDFAMAFDTLDRGFLFKVLSSYDIGPNLISWVKLMCEGAEASIINNGFPLLGSHCRRD